MRSPDSKSINRVNALKYSTLAIISVFFAEAFSGLIVNSLAILSDCLHALFDALSSTLLLVSARISLKPPDEEHMYGHEKFEMLGGLIGGFTLVTLAIYIAIDSGLKILRGEPYIKVDLSLVGFFTFTYTLIIDLFRAFIFKLTFERSPTIIAGLYHALSDLVSTLIAFLGYWLSIHGFFYGDSFASLILSIFLILLSAKLIWNNIMELSDIAPKEVATKVREKISDACENLFSYENLKIRKVGNKLFVRATFKIPDYMSFEEAHISISKIEDKIRSEFKDADIYFHIEPAGIRGLPTKEFIEGFASKFKDVKGIHDINIYHLNGKIYITLHVQVDPLMPLSRAHELSEEIEKAIHGIISNVGAIFVHIEPSNIEFSRGRKLNEKDICTLVHLAAEKYRDKLMVKRVIYHTVSGKLCINVECILNEEVSVEEAHKIATEIEEAIKNSVSETIVTVHVEPKADKGKT